MCNNIQQHIRDSIDGDTIHPSDLLDFLTYLADLESHFSRHSYSAEKDAYRNAGADKVERFLFKLAEEYE